MAPRLPLFGGTSPFGQLRREEQTAGCRIAIWIAERPHCRRHFPSRRTGNNRPDPAVQPHSADCPVPTEALGYARKPPQMATIPSGLYVAKSETVRVPLYRRVKHLGRMRVAIVGKDGRLRVEDETGCLYLIADSGRVDPM